MIRKLVESYRDIYAEEKLPVPKWVDMLEESAELAARSPEPPDELECVLKLGDRVNRDVSS